METITKRYKIKKLEKEKRPDFLPAHFQGVIHGISVESIVCSVMTKYVEEYSGGYWEFFQIQDGENNTTLPLMVWGEEKEVTLQGAYEDLKVNGLTASLGVLIMALNLYIFKMRESEARDRFINLFYALRDFAFSKEDERIDHEALYSFLD